MFRKLVVSLVLIATLAVTMIGAAAPSKAQDEVSLLLWIMPNGSNPAAAIETEIAAFEAANPGITVEYEILDWGSAWTRITTAASAGEGPDVSQLGTTWVAAVDAMGALAELPELDPAAFTAASWNTAVPIGKEVAVSAPWFTDVRVMAYRTDVFEQLGLNADEMFADWDSFKAGLQTIKDANLPDDTGEGTMAPFAFPGRNDWNVAHNFVPWIWSNGGDWFTEDLSAAALNSPEAVEGIFFYANLYNEGLTPTDTLEKNSAEIEGLWQDGKAAIWFAVPSIIGNTRNTAENGGYSEKVAAANLGLAQFPASPATGERYTFVGGSNLTVWNTSEHPEEAMALMNFLLSTESQVRYATTIGMLPTTVEALADPAITEDPMYSLLIPAVENGKSYPALASWGAIENVLTTSLGAMWDEVAAGNIKTQEDVQAVLDAAADEIDVLLLAE